MMLDFKKVFEIATAFGAMCGTAYYVLCAWSARSFLRAQRAAVARNAAVSPFSPPVSILKPLKGVDPEMYQSFLSHCLQEYPKFEIIFGVSDASDPSLELVRRLQAKFPDKAIQVLICKEKLGANTKVSNLAQMVAAAQYEYLVVNDSDIRVEPDYLRRVVSPLSDPTVGMVTCLYRGVAASTLGSRLESLGISTDFSAGVLAARYLEGGVRFGLGSTLALRLSDLQAIGGYESIVDYLADDYEIGRRIASRGLRVHLSEVLVETFLPAYSLRGYASHQLRWARGVRDSRPWGYLGLVFTFGFVWALLALLVSHGALWAWRLLGVTLAARLLMALLVGVGVLRDRPSLRYLWLIPVRDVVAVCIWLASFAGHTVAWRGDSFYLKDGKLARIGP
jgi:ceramide glucosyltransferase